MEYSASAAIVIEGLHAAQEPAMREPSMTYSPRCPSTRPASSTAAPNGMPPTAWKVVSSNRFGRR